MQDVLSRSYTGEYGSSTSPNTNTYALTSAPYSQVEYSNSERSTCAYQQDIARRSSHPSGPSAPFFDSAMDMQRQHLCSLVDFSRISSGQPQQNSLNDALDASRGMVSLSQGISPRGISMATKAPVAARPTRTVSHQHALRTRRFHRPATTRQTTMAVRAPSPTTAPRQSPPTS